MDRGVWLSRSVSVTGRSTRQAGGLQASSVFAGGKGGCARVSGRAAAVAPATDFGNRAAAGTKATEGGLSRICVKAFRDRSPCADEKTELRFGPVPTSSFNPRMP